MNVNVPWNIDNVQLKLTKHFALAYMRRWGWDFQDLREAIRAAYKVEKTGNTKFEIYVQKAGFKKIITAYYHAENELVCISGAEGGTRQ